MSYQINTAFVQQFSTNVGMLLQQMGSRFRPYVKVEPCVGKAATLLEQFGAVTAVRSIGRHGDTPLISTPQDRRWVFPTDYDWADLIDDQDKLRTLIDPQSPYAQLGAASLGRAFDDEFLAGFFGPNFTGENGTTNVGILSAFNSGSQLVNVQTGASANTGMNVAKLRRAKRILMEAEVDVDREQLYIAIAAKQHDDLLNEVQATSRDFNDVPTLVGGRIMKFMGFNFINTERIPGGAGFDVARNPLVTGYTTGSRWLCPVWAESGVKAAIWNDITTSIDKRADKRNSTQVYVTGTFGASRLEERRCVIIDCV